MCDLKVYSATHIPQELLKQTQTQLEKCQVVNTQLLTEKSVQDKRQARLLSAENTIRLGHFTSQMYVCVCDLLMINGHLSKVAVFTELFLYHNCCCVSVVTVMFDEVHRV